MFLADLNLLEHVNKLNSMFYLIVDGANVFFLDVVESFFLFVVSVRGIFVNTLLPSLPLLYFCLPALLRNV